VKEIFFFIKIDTIIMSIITTNQIIFKHNFNFDEKSDLKNLTKIKNCIFFKNWDQIETKNTE